jgi:hypothetical protein
MRSRRVGSARNRLVSASTRSAGRWRSTKWAVVLAQVPALDTEHPQRVLARPARARLRSNHGHRRDKARPAITAVNRRNKAGTDRRRNKVTALLPAATVLPVATEHRVATARRALADTAHRQGAGTVHRQEAVMVEGPADHRRTARRKEATILAGMRPPRAAWFQRSAAHSLRRRRGRPTLAYAIRWW